MRKLTMIIVACLVVFNCADNEPPEVEITNPSDGDVVSGTVSITVSALDNKGIESVYLYIDGNVAEIFTSMPYSYNWQTTSLPDSSTHDIHAVADDKANNSGRSSTITVTVYNGTANNPPDTPTTPSGPSAGQTGISYNFTSSATDPDNDSISIRFDWDDGDTSSWSSYLPSGSSTYKSHSWSNSGTYYIRAQAKDIIGATSGWSSSHSITISGGGGSFYESDDFDFYPSPTWDNPPYVLLDGYGNWTSVEWNIMRGEAAGFDSNYIQVRDFPPGSNNHATYHLSVSGNIVSLTVGFRYFMDYNADIFIFISPNNSTWTEVTDQFGLIHHQPPSDVSADLTSFVAGYGQNAYIRFEQQAYSGDYWHINIDDFWVSGSFE